MVYFMLAFVARPLHDVVDARATVWLVSNRRYLGLSFAAWHLLHWPILVCFYRILGPDEFWDDFYDILMPGIVILLVITFMAATSTDRAQRWLGMRTWSALHTIGAYTVWAWAFQIYLQRIPERADRHDYVYVWALVAVLAVRWIARVKRVIKPAATRARP
jgi:sulfoxide reductase heme-binding subunit YedZ